MTTPSTGTTELQLPLTHEVTQLFPRQGEWTEADYWPLSERNRIIELSDGRLIVPPMPTTEHQYIVGNIYFALRLYMETNDLGVVVPAPLPVRLWPKKVREPDVMVMLNENLDRIQQQYWERPDLAVEVLSPGTQSTDRTEKLAEYAAAGIKEYWIVVPEAQSVELYTLAGFDAAALVETYALVATYSGSDQIESRVLAGFVMPIAQVFKKQGRRETSS